MLLCMCSRKGHLQFFMKEYEKAAETYEAGLEHDPNNLELKDGIARCMEAVNKVQKTCCLFPGIQHGLACISMPTACLCMHVSTGIPQSKAQGMYIGIEAAKAGYWQQLLPWPGCPIGIRSPPVPVV